MNDCVQITSDVAIELGKSCSAFHLIEAERESV